MPRIEREGEKGFHTILYSQRKGETELGEKSAVLKRQKEKKRGKTKPF